MVSKHTLQNIVWIDVVSPSNDEVDQLMEEYGLHSDIAEELTHPTLKPRVEIYANCIYLILHFPALRHSHKESPAQEVDFIVGENFLITAHYDLIDPLHKFSKEFEVKTLLSDKERGVENATALFLAIARKLYRGVMHELGYINDMFGKTEEKMFAGHEKEAVVELSMISRDLLTIKHILSSHYDILNSLKTLTKNVPEGVFGQYARDLGYEYQLLWRAAENNMEYLRELRATNSALLSTKENEIMKTLTIMAFVTFPLALIANIFGMNTQTLPIIGQPNDFWIIIGIMTAATLCFFIFFKSKKWL